MNQAAVQVIGFVVAFPLGALLGAVIVQFATPRIAGFKPKFWVAYLAAVLAAIVGLVIGFFIGFMLILNGQQGSGSVTVLSMVIGFFAQAGCYTLLLKHPETGNISFGKACLIALVQSVVGVVVIGLLVLVLAGFMYMYEHRYGVP